MTHPTRYREIDVAGTPLQMGRQVGEAAREEIRGFCAVALEQVNKTVRVSRARALQVARRSMEFAKGYGPDMMEELRGTAEAAGVTLDDLMLLQVRNQLTPDEGGGCTSFSVAAGPSAKALSFVAQNWDNDPELDPYTLVLRRRPLEKPASMCLTQAGLIGYIGLNEAGMGLCLNTLPAPSRHYGVPHYFTVRAILESTNLGDAVDAVRRAQRAIPANIMLATPGGPADLEVTIGDVHVLRDNGDGRLGHSNHCVHSELTPINNRFPELIDSHFRKRRVDELLGRLPAVPTLETIQAILRDHENYPRSICRHANDDEQYGHWQSVFSVIIEPPARRMHVSRGTPCERPYEVYNLI
jgi:isopenicillin-N N-acyltransferase-like protein